MVQALSSSEMNMQRGLSSLESSGFFHKQFSHYFDVSVLAFISSNFSGQIPTTFKIYLEDFVNTLIQ